MPIQHFEQASMTPFQRTHSRSRTWSLYSTSSSGASSSYSSWNPTAIPPPKPTAGEDRAEQAWGAFVPLSSAAASSLRYVASDSNSYSNNCSPASASAYTSGQRLEKVGTRPQKGLGNQLGAPAVGHRSRSPPSSLALLDIPVIVRTGTDFAPPPSSSSSSSLSSEFSPTSDASPTEYLHPTLRHSTTKVQTTPSLHPVLARLERSSKFCTNKMACAACGKSGRDFPACGKCKKMWCSRECRLQGGKRHAC